MASTIRFFSLIAALLLYAGLSSPTPDHPGVIEAIIGLLLSAAALPGLIGALYQAYHGTLALWQKAALFALTYMLCTAPLIGMLGGAQGVDILRDSIAALYVFLPLFIADLFKARPDRTRILILTMILMGTLFALRTLAQDYESLLAQWFPVLSPSQDIELTYLANAPTLLFTAGWGYFLFCTALPPGQNQDSSVIRSLAFLIASLLCLSAMGLSLQRASLGAFILIALATHLTLLRQAPLKSLLLLGLIALTLLLIHPLAEPLWQTLQALLNKTQQHGLNSRAEEWAAVFENLSAAPLSAVIGKGFGSGFYSPATEGAFVTFTHGLISASLLKTGLIGTVILGSYIALLLGQLALPLKHAPILALCLLAPIAIDITLYGAYKSLDFGVMLAQIVSLPSLFFSGENSSPPHRRELKKSGSLCNNKADFQR